MPRPTLSICIIVGDAHVALLPRCLRTLLDRPEGPACDELVIGWNGNDDAAFAASLAAALEWEVDDVKPFLPLGASTRFNRGGSDVTNIEIVLHRYEWKGDFADARNNNFTEATGEWRMYVDVDDILADANHPAFADSLEQDPPTVAFQTFPVAGTLVDYFRKLPAHINVVLAPYNYVNTDKGRPVIRKRRPRAVRWTESHFVWTSEVHEVLVSALGREVAAWAPGILLVHEPVIAAEVRSERNTAILAEQEKRLKREGVNLPGIIIYAQAQDLLGARDFGAAAKMFEKAALAPDTGTEDKILFIMLASRASMEHGDFNDAGKHALTVIDLAPLRPEGYLLASEACYRMYQYDRCIAWYEAAKGKRPPEGGPMMDDRIERCIRPVAFVGLAYLRIGRFAEALAVAEVALKEGNDAFALRLKQEATDGMKRQAVAAKAGELADALLTLGFAKTADRVLEHVSRFGEFRPQRRQIEERLSAESSAFPAGSLVAEWLAEALPDGMLGLPVPLDSADVPAAVVDAMDQAAATRNAGTLRVAVTDTLSGGPFAVSNRVDSMEPEQIAKVLEAHGDVEQLSLIEDPTGSYIVGEAKRRKNPGPRVADITLFSPVYAEPWGPWRILKDGTGGSEESVIYLARALRERGYAVDVFAALDAKRHRGLHVEGGVYWRHLDAFDPVKRIPGVTIAQRAPWAIRISAFDPKRLYIWHQDADYHLGWNTAIAATVKHFFVSKWQRQRLLLQANATCADNDVLFDSFGAVIGNGIPQSALDVPFDESKRDPMSCAYISSPVRGLTALLTMWPEIRASFPEATLRIYYGWETSRAFPGAAKAQAETMSLVRKTPGAQWVGRLPQVELERDLVERGIWTYPCLFPEGFCNAGVRAAAAGLVPVYRGTAAMPEIQFPSPYMSADVEWQHDGVDHGKRLYAEKLLCALQDTKTGAIGLKERQNYRDWAARTWTWDRVASAVIAQFERDGHFRLRDGAQVEVSP